MSQNNRIVIPLPLATLNQYINAERTNRFKAAKIKHAATDVAKMFTIKAMREGVRFQWGVPLRFDWYCANKRTDPDNVAFQHKFVFDGMMAAGFLENDNWAHIVELNDRFFIDKRRPRVEVYEIGE